MGAKNIPYKPAKTLATVVEQGPIAAAQQLDFFVPTPILDIQYDRILTDRKLSLLVEKPTQRFFSLYSTLKAVTEEEVAPDFLSLLPETGNPRTTIWSLAQLAQAAGDYTFASQLLRDHFPVKAMYLSYVRQNVTLDEVLKIADSDVLDFFAIQHQDDEETWRKINTRKYVVQLEEQDYQAAFRTAKYLKDFERMRDALAAGFPKLLGEQMFVGKYDYTPDKQEIPRPTELKIVARWARKLDSPYADDLYCIAQRAAENVSAHRLAAEIAFERGAHEEAITMLRLWAESNPFSREDKKTPVRLARKFAASQAVYRELVKEFGVEQAALPEVMRLTNLQKLLPEEREALAKDILRRQLFFEYTGTPFQRFPDHPGTRADDMARELSMREEYVALLTELGFLQHAYLFSKEEGLPTQAFFEDADRKMRSLQSFVRKRSEDRPFYKNRRTPNYAFLDSLLDFPMNIVSLMDIISPEEVHGELGGYGVFLQTIDDEWNVEREEFFTQEQKDMLITTQLYSLKEMGELLGWLLPPDDPQQRVARFRQRGIFTPNAIFSAVIQPNNLLTGLKNRLSHLSGRMYTDRLENLTAALKKPIVPDPEPKRPTWRRN